jgi:hypothetical protein
MGRLLVVAAAALPLSVALWSESAQGVGVRLVLDCSNFKDAMILSPGLSNTPTNQTVTAFGRLYGCNKAGGGGHYHATLTMTRATCASRRFEGEAQFDWVNGRTSTGHMELVPAAVAPRKLEVGGTITGGLFNGLKMRGWVRMTDTFRGTGPECGPTNLLKRIEFTNTRSFQLLARPATTTTTVPRHTSTSAPRPTNPPTIPPTNPPPRNTPGPPGSIATAALRQVSSDGTQGPSGSTGSLALTGNSSRGALLGLESLFIGGAVWALGGHGRRRDLSSNGSLPRRGWRRLRRARPWLLVTMPGDPV